MVWLVQTAYAGVSAGTEVVKGRLRLDDGLEEVEEIVTCGNRRVALALMVALDSAAPAHLVGGVLALLGVVDQDVGRIEGLCVGEGVVVVASLAAELGDGVDEVKGVVKAVDGKFSQHVLVEDEHDGR